MNKNPKISFVSIIAFIFSVTALILFWMLLEEGVDVLLLWITLSIIALVFPVFSKYIRIKQGAKGKAIEIAALVIGSFDFYFVIFVRTKWNLLMAYGIIAAVCVLYAKLFNNLAPHKERAIKEEQNANHPPEDKEFLAELLAFSAAESAKAIKANQDAQSAYLNDPEYGLVPGKPIYCKFVDGSQAYLNSLQTIIGEKLRWNRRGSTSAEGIHGMIDIYDSFLPSGELYQTVYVNMYADVNATTAPTGFMFAQSPQIDKPGKPAMQRYCKYCGGAIGSDTKKCYKCGKQNLSKTNQLLLVNNLISIVLTIVSITAIITAMNTQDINRNAMEERNPTLIYFLLLGLHIAFLAILFVARKKSEYKGAVIFSPLLAIASVLAIIEHSVFSEWYFDSINAVYQYYCYNDVVAVCNGIWVILSFSVCVVNLSAIFNFAREAWYTSAIYRDKCYKRVAKMHDYLNAGVITQEEFEENKELILRKIQQTEIPPRT